MRRRGRIRRYILLTILLLILAGYAAGDLVSLAAPVFIRTAIIDTFEAATGKHILVGSIRLNMFRGVILDKVIIYEKARVLVRAKQVRAYVPISRVLHKQVIIPFIRIDSPSFLLERREDGTFNLADLIPMAALRHEGVSVIIRRIIVKGGRVWFVDRMLDPDLKKPVENVHADIRFTPPTESVAYSLSFTLPGKPPAAFSVTGEYLISRDRLSAEITARNAAASFFAGYLSGTSFRCAGGLVSGRIFMTAEKGLIAADVDGRTDDLVVAADAVRATCDATIAAKIRYRAADKHIEYEGEAAISSLELAGIKELGTLRDIKGRILFDKTRLWSDGLECTALGIPWKARVNLVNFATPLIDIHASAETKLGALQKTLCEECGAKLPVELAGEAWIDISASFESGKPSKVNGYIRLRDATMRLGNGRYPVERINGEAHFTPREIEWSRMEFLYRGMSFTTKGTLTNFASPGIRLEAASKDLAFTTVCNMDGSLITLTELKGHYLNSTFTLSGDLDIRDQANVAARVRGSADLRMADVRTAGSRSAGVRKMKPRGRILAEFALAGGLKDLTACTIHAKVKSPFLSLYGARLSDVSIDFVQEGGMGQVKGLQARCYGGVVKASGKLDYIGRGQPFSLIIDAQDIMLERLKADTGFRAADVSGDLKVYANLKGFFKDFTRTTGLGRITIADGKLWELNLFKGLGTAIFTSDFKNIVFSEGACDFKIADGSFYADSLELKGELLRLSGLGRFGFDKSVDVLVRSELTDEAMSLSTDTQRGIAMAVQDGTTFEITGSFRDPKFTTRTDVAVVLGGVAGAILQPQ